MKKTAVLGMYLAFAMILSYIEVLIPLPIQPDIRQIPPFSLPSVTAFFPILTCLLRPYSLNSPIK